MKHLSLLVPATSAFAQETVSFDLVQPDEWTDALSLFIVGLTVWTISAALVRLAKGPPKVEIPRSIVPKD